MELHPYPVQRICIRAYPRRMSRLLYRRSNMIAVIARWSHNVLLTATGLLTIALLVSAK
jgi:hypothetical protein